ncbi:nucleotide-binding domain-containing protein [Serendipita vermifera]|nr:nucleotide-binding domain-containing protein [Serendipita vermifera]
MSRETKHVLIVGTGCFGLSTAFHLLHANTHDHSSTTTTITLLDASSTIPAPDAASSDLNKVVRSSYSDSFYTWLAREAIQVWKQGDVDADVNTHVTPSVDGNPVYAIAGLQNDIAAGADVHLFDSNNTQLPDPREFWANHVHRTDTSSGDVPLGSLFDSERMTAYLNKDGGWAAASKAMHALLENVQRMGAQVVPGAIMVGFSSCRRDGGGGEGSGDVGNSGIGVENGDRVIDGVIVQDGRRFTADIIVLAMGAWTPSAVAAIPRLSGLLQDKLTATGQTIATVQLDTDMAKRYRDVPVLLDWATGFYIFPPNEDGIMKIALHANGHSHFPATPDSTPSQVSTPRTVRTHGEQHGTRVPREILRSLHAFLQSVYPELAQLPFDKTRMCWYMDTPDEDWIIDDITTLLSDKQNEEEVGEEGGVGDGQGSRVIIATGGSGHAFKFLPVIGRLVKERIEGTLDPQVTQKFSIGRKFDAAHIGSRQGQAKVLNEADLCSANEFNNLMGLSR